MPAQTRLDIRDRHKKAHYRYRRTGIQTYYSKNEPGTEAFSAELRACNDGVSAPELEAGASRAAVGTFDDLLERYYRSPDFLDPGERTRVVYRGTLKRWRTRTRKGRRYGEVTVRELQPRHVEAMLAELLGAWAARSGSLPVHGSGLFEPRDQGVDRSHDR